MKRLLEIDFSGRGKAARGADFFNALLGKKTLSDLRCDSTLLAWIKFLYMDGLESLRFPRGKVLSHMANRRQAIALLVSEWPEQLNIVDFKRQSASMFAAQQRDIETLRILLAGRM